MLFFLILIVLLNTFLVFSYDKLDRLINIYDTPDSLRKLHKGKVPLTGGFLIFFNLIFFSFIDFILGYKIFFFEDLFNYNRIYFSFIFGLIAFFSLGLLDDKKSIPANIKLVIQILIIFIILLLDPNLKIEFLRIGFLNKNFTLNEFSLIFTILCFLLFINAFNMFDGINGQSGLYAALNLLIFYLVSNQTVFLLLIFIMTIFLYRNIKNKFFLGNSGSYFLSYLISFYFIKFYNVGIIRDSDFIFLAMLTPGIDMLRLFFLRIYKGSSPFKADRNHLHHILLRKFSYINSILILICFMCLPLIINYIFDKIFLIIFLTLISYFLLLYNIKTKMKN
jgi:UDP-GlcNAc:undecaprenyl-phosphate GlcNAc-1-phosphate transferase